MSSTVEDPAAGRSRDEQGPAFVEWQGVAVTYPGPPPVHALLPTDISLHAGEQVAIIGPSGSGKSTALNVLGLLDRPTAGRFLLAGRDVTGLSERDSSGWRATLIGFVFQSFHLLLDRSAHENVMLGMLYGPVPRRRRAELATQALERVGLAHRVDARCALMSGGERQRVAVARAICHQPRLLLADEPTGNLDQRTGGQILDLLDELSSPDILQVVVTHDPTVARRCQRVLQVVDGRLTEVSL